MNDLTFKIISDLPSAQEIYNRLSPKDTIYDLWELRYTYFKYFSFPLFFYTAFEDDEPVALLPLQFNTEKKHLEFFGGSYFEDNSVFTKSGFESITEELLKKIDQPALLEWMDEPLDPEHTQLTAYKYELPLSSFSSLDEYLMTWEKKSRQNIKAQMRKLEEQHLKIEYGNLKDFDFMIEKNIERFGEESTFHFPHRVDFLRDILYLPYSQIITLSLSGKKVAVGMSLLYNNIYTGLNSGVEKNINGLGKIVNFEKVRQALSLRAKLYDARADDLGWKESFQFQKRPQYTLDLRK